MRIHYLLSVFGVAALVFLSTSADAKKYRSRLDVGNSTMTAVFDAPLGERITAISSQISCELDVSPNNGAVKGTCTLPLTSIVVDGEPTKTDHFYQWATNKKMKPKQCKFELALDGTAKVDSKAKDGLRPRTPVAYEIDGTFTICDRKHKDGNKEKITGQVLLFAAGEYGKSETLRIRARIDRFNRQAYHIGPRWTSGWLAKVQALAPVVAAEGTIDLNIFAELVDEVARQ